MKNKKAFIRIDYNGNVIPGTLVFRDSEPQNGLWKEVTYDYCCQSTTSAPTAKWWLAGGIPESSDYTIYDPASATSEADSYINLANPGVRNAIPFNNPTFTPGVGWSGNGTNMYFDTQTTFNANTTILVMYRDPDSGRYLFGALQVSPNRTATIIPYSSTNVDWQMAGTFITTARRHLGGVIGATMERGYRNGIRDNNTNFVWSGTPTTRTIKLLAYDNGSILGFSSATIHRVAIYNIKLTDSQIFEVCNKMLEIGQSYLHPYANKILSLNPVFYLPCNIKPGFMFFKDYSVNNIVTTYYSRLSWNAIIDGKYGNAVHCDASIPNSQILPSVEPNYNNLRNFNIDECTVVMWLRLNYTPALNQKLIEMWRTGWNEYIAYEVRGTNKYGYFTRSNSLSQDNSTLFTGGSGWHHVVCFNSVSNGVVGMYYDGVKYENTKTIPATSATTNQLIEIGIIDGDIQHIAIFDRLLTQSEINYLQ